MHPRDIIATALRLPALEAWRVENGGQAIQATIEPTGRARLTVIQKRPSYRVLANRNGEPNSDAAFEHSRRAIQMDISPLRLHSATASVDADRPDPIDVPAGFDPTQILRDLSACVAIEHELDLDGDPAQVEIQASGPDFGDLNPRVECSIRRFSDWSRVEILAGSPLQRLLAGWMSAAWPWLSRFTILRCYGALTAPTAHERMGYANRIAALSIAPSAGPTPTRLRIDDDRLILGYVC